MIYGAQQRCCVALSQPFNELLFLHQDLSTRCNESIHVDNSMKSKTVNLVAPFAKRISESKNDARPKLDTAQKPISCAR
jgi:hypothetical protein